MTKRLRIWGLLMISLLLASCSDSKENFVFGPTPGDGVTESCDCDDQK
ncbi:MAG: hypothetical protein JSS10_01250 [Verrucomicrobia bacterium]|nr:hypothetical protein [Verrucomicrobiota bacterium]